MRGIPDDTVRYGVAPVRTWGPNMPIRIMIFSFALALAACGRSAPPPPPAEAAQLRDLGNAIETATGAYAVRSASATTPADCRAARADYEKQVGPAIDAIRTLGSRLDPWIQDRGPSEHADVECQAGAMLAEFERHTDIACTSLDLVANRTEAARHVVAMDRWADLAVARASSIGVATEAKGPRCVRFEDGDRMYMP